LKNNTVPPVSAGGIFICQKAGKNIFEKKKKGA